MLSRALSVAAAVIGLIAAERGRSADLSARDAQLLPVGLFETVVNWVEKGVAPTMVRASRQRADGTTLTRPLCPYPATAKWTGSGSSDVAANFVCVDGQHRPSDFRIDP